MMFGKENFKLPLDNITITRRTLRCCAYYYRQSKTIRMYLRPFQNPEIKICIPSRPFVRFGGVSKKSITNFIYKKLSWIEKHVEQWPEQQQPLQKGFIPCFGNNYTINNKFIETSTLNSRIQSTSNNTEHHIDFYGKKQQLGPAIERWLKSQLIDRANKILPNYLTQISWDKINPKLSLSGAYRIWGCCHTKSHKISLNWRLALAPKNIFEYVLAHEVAHLIHPNHGDQFWQLTNRLFTETDANKIWLKNNINELYSWDFS